MIRSFRIRVLELQHIGRALACEPCQLLSIQHSGMSVDLYLGKLFIGDVSISPRFLEAFSGLGRVLVWGMAPLPGLVEDL